MVAFDKVQLAEDGGAVEVVGQVLHVGQWVPVEDGDLVSAPCVRAMTRRILSGVLYLIQPLQGPASHCPTFELWKKRAYVWFRCDAPHRGWELGACPHRVELRGIQQEVPGHHLGWQRERQGLPLLGGWLAKQ